MEIKVGCSREKAEQKRSGPGAVSEDQTHSHQSGWGIKRVGRRDHWGQGPTSTDIGLGGRRVSGG